MPRYLLIEFDQTAQADALRAQIDAATRKGKPFRVVGVFAKPGPTFCQCATWVSSRVKSSTLKRGKKFGWDVCTECKRPAPIINFLRNLLEPSEIIDPQLTEIKGVDGIKRKLGFYFYGITAPSLQFPK